jgi:hypothetical protein
LPQTPRRHVEVSSRAFQAQQAADWRGGSHKSKRQIGVRDV